MTQKVQKMEFIGHSWYWASGPKRGHRISQEEFLIPGTPLPIGYADHGKPTSRGDIHIASSPEGLWVMDRLASLHRYPFQTREAAEAYERALKGKGAK